MTNKKLTTLQKDTKVHLMDANPFKTVGYILPKGMTVYINKRHDATFIYTETLVGFMEDETMKTYIPYPIN